MSGCAARAPAPASLRRPKSRPWTAGNNRNRNRATTTTTSAGSVARRAPDSEGQDERQPDTPTAIAAAAVAATAKKVFTWGRAICGHLLRSSSTRLFAPPRIN
jgi:hypothetical protein